jgi:hypothetical protein
MLVKIIQTKMQSKIEAPSSEQPHTSRRQKANRAAAALAAATAFGGLTAPVAHAEDSHTKGAKIEAGFGRLRNPHELPGRKIHLGAEILDQLKSATVEMGIRIRPDLLPEGTPEEPFQSFCTAAKVHIDGDQSDEFTTAAHCLNALTGAKYGAFIDTLNPGVKAENFTELSQYQFAILDPNEFDLAARKARPVALVDQISISTDDKDTALMRVSPIIYSDTSATVRTLDQIPSLPYAALKKKPVLGTPVALYGVPQASGFEPAAKTGTYLGRYKTTYYDDSIKQEVVLFLDIVGINTGNPQSDSCNFGASGSVAELPDGQILGNLSIRNNLGYGPTKSMQTGDISLQQNINWVIQKENQLGVKIRGNFNTVCSFTVLDKNTPQQMVIGYDRPAAGKGADPSGGQG